MDETTETLVTNWLAYIESDHADSDAGWSFDRLTEMTRSTPREAWEVIRELVRRAGSEKVIGVIGAGPLEDLLSFNGALILPLLEKEAPTNERMRDALRRVWKFQMDDALWARVQELRGSAGKVGPKSSA